MLFLVGIGALSYANDNRLISIDPRQEILIKKKLGNWSKSESEVLAAAQEQNLPILAAFVGRSFCPWSQKLVAEVLTQRAFYTKVRTEAILWHIPIHHKADEDELGLRAKYKVGECPLILLLDPQGREFARIDYLSLEAGEFAEKIAGIIADFQEVCIALDEPEHVEASKWQELYAMAREFSVPYFRDAILQRGLKSEFKAYFLMEKYAALVEKCSLRNDRVKQCRYELLSSDPHNREGIPLKVAMLEFDKLSKSLKRKDRVEKALRPLFEYLHLFGEKDPENAWRVEMMVAQYLFTKNAVQAALEYAHRSYQKAPDPAKAEIADSILFMQSKGQT